MADFDINAHLRQSGFGMGQGGANDQKPPEDLSDFINKLFDQFSKWISKGTGVKLDSLVNTGLGAHADITKAGIQVNNSPQSIIPDAKGGLLANIAFGEVFTKAGASHGIGGAPTGEGGGSGSSGNQSFDSYAASSGMSDMFIAAGGGNHFAVSNVDMGDIGTFRPLFTPSGQGLDTDRGIG